MRCPVRGGTEETMARAMETLPRLLLVTLRHRPILPLPAAQTDREPSSGERIPRSSATRRGAFRSAAVMEMGSTSQAARTYLGREAALMHR